MLCRVTRTMILLAGALLLLVFSPQAEAQGRLDVRGTWHSVSIERTVGGNYMRRLFTFTGDEWEVIYTVYADPDHSDDLTASIRPST